jgi:hypothetical protein
VNNIITGLIGMAAKPARESLLANTMRVYSLNVTQLEGGSLGFGLDYEISKQ